MLDLIKQHPEAVLTIGALLIGLLAHTSRFFIVRWIEDVSNYIRGKPKDNTENSAQFDDKVWSQEAANAMVRDLEKQFEQVQATWQEFVTMMQSQFVLKDACDERKLKEDDWQCKNEQILNKHHEFIERSASFRLTMAEGLLELYRKVGINESITLDKINDLITKSRAEQTK